MIAMRAALGILCLQCLLLTGTARSTPAAAIPAAAAPVAKAVAAVMVDGKGPFRFIIDTGANDSSGHIPLTG